LFWWEAIYLQLTVNSVQLTVEKMQPSKKRKYNDCAVSIAIKIVTRTTRRVLLFKTRRDDSKDSWRLTVYSWQLETKQK